MTIDNQLSARAWTILRQALEPGVSFPEQGPDNDLTALVAAGYLAPRSRGDQNVAITPAGGVAIQRRIARQLDEISRLGT